MSIYAYSSFHHNTRLITHCSPAGSLNSQVTFLLQRVYNKVCAWIWQRQNCSGQKKSSRRKVWLIASDPDLLNWTGHVQQEKYWRVKSENLKTMTSCCEANFLNGVPDICHLAMSEADQTTNNIMFGAKRLYLQQEPPNSKPKMENTQIWKVNGGWRTQRWEKWRIWD